jgi:uncharacterized protein
MRLLASLHHCLATVDGGGLQVHQYATGRLGADVAGAGRVAVEVRTGYPFHGRVEVEVIEPGAEAWTVSLRVPAWCEGATLDAGGDEVPVAVGTCGRVRRTWRAGDRVVLDLPMVPRLTAPHPRIDAVRGCLAIERGPLVYCVEGADVPGGRVDDVLIDPAEPPREIDRPDLLGGVVAVRAAGRRRAGGDDSGDAAPWPYGAPAAEPPATEDEPVTL